MLRAGRILSFVAAAAFACGATSLYLVSPAAAAAYDSSYQFESAFLANLKPGDTGTFSVFFSNVGSLTWSTGTATQVNLAVCGADKVTCNMASPQAAWASGWLSMTAYTTHAKTAVAPGDFSAFTYAIKVPANASAGAYRFNGDLVVASTGTKVHPEGYYQDAVAVAAAPAATAPSGVQTQVGSFDGGPSNNDVRVFFTAPSSNGAIGYEIQRVSGHCGVAVDSPFWFTITTLTAAPGSFAAYNDLDRASGFYCYQVRVSTGSSSFAYSNQAEATVFGAASGPPFSTSAVLQTDAGTIGRLDAGDRFAITFSDVVQVSQVARIGVTDADCGAPSSQAGPPASCSSGNTQTVSNITCGTNATCFLSLDGKTLTVTMSGIPADVNPGSVPGSQYPLVFTDSAGIANNSGTQWSITTSTDRVIGPVGQ